MERLFGTSTPWKAMAIHSSTLAWKIPWMEEPDRLQGYSPWGHKESDTTEWLNFHFHSLEWSVSRREIKGIDLLSPSQLLFLIGQNFPPTVLNPANLQTVSLTSSCWGNETYVCVWTPPLSLETVLRIRASALGRSGSKAGDKGCADPGPPTPGS